MAPSSPGKAALPFSTQWPPPLSRTGRQRARTGPCAARPPLLRPEEGSGGSRAPRGRALARGRLPFTGLGATRSHRCPSCPRTGRVWGPNCSRNVAFQRNPVDSGLLPSAASLRFRVLREWQVGGRSLVQGHPPVGCRPRGEGMPVGVSAGHDGAVKGGPQRSAWPVLPRRPCIAICVWVSLETG